MRALAMLNRQDIEFNATHDCWQRAMPHPPWLQINAMMQNAEPLEGLPAKLMSELLGALRFISDFDDRELRTVWQQIRFELASMIIWLLQDMQRRVGCGDADCSCYSNQFRWADRLASAIRSTDAFTDAPQKECGAAFDDIIACTTLLFSPTDSAGIITRISGRLELSVLKCRAALIAALYLTLYSLCRDCADQPLRSSACVISAVQNYQSTIQLSLVGGSLTRSEISALNSLDGLTNLVALLDGEFRVWTSDKGTPCLSISFPATVEAGPRSRFRARFC